MRPHTDPHSHPHTRFHSHTCSDIIGRYVEGIVIKTNKGKEFRECV